MKSILVFQHVAHEILGTFHPMLRDAGFRIRYTNFGRHPDAKAKVERYDGLIILGGPMGVYEADRYPHLNEEMRAIREAIAQKKPVLGICLGAQLIAAALGAVVEPVPADCKEIGWFEVALTEEGKKDPLLGALGATERIFQWHGDTFQLPPKAAWLARSKACAHQAFRFESSVYGFQFHLEVDEKMIERWVELQGCADPERIRADTLKFIDRQKALSREVFSRYVALFSTKRRKLLLGSGRE